MINILRTKSTLHILLAAVFLFTTLSGCKTSDKKVFEPASLVNLHIGTGSSNTFVTAVYPFGMVSPGPFYNIRKGGHLDTTFTIGFSHIHASGVGCADIWGGISLMPVTNESTLTRDGFSSPLRDEVAMPGYYSVKLTKYNIQAEMTSAPRTAFHRYTFRKGSEKELLIDLTHHLNASFDRTEIQLNNRFYPGKSFVIRVEKNKPEDAYIRSVKLNGRTYGEYHLSHQDIVHGGTLDIHLTDSH